MRFEYQRNRLGVNFGGWLVTEKWLAPSLYKDTAANDEYHFMQTLDAQKKISAHRKAFITEEDWRWLAENNITFVRLPVGHWALHDNPPFINTKRELDWAFSMAEKYHIDILLDLHAIKGSQNGEVHSGRIGTIDWWAQRQQTLETIVELADCYKNSSALWGFEILNEPKPWRHYFKLLWLYRHAHKLLVGILPSHIAIVFHDAFIPLFMSGALRRTSQHPIIMDSHFYLVANNYFSSRSQIGYDKIRARVNSVIIRLSSLLQPVIVGEWSAILPQPIFDRQPQKSHPQLLRQTINAQQKTYQHAVLSCYWNYKAEGRGMYNFRSLVEDGVIKTSSKG